MIDSWGCTTKENYDTKVERTTKYKPELLTMANLVNKHLKAFYTDNPTFRWFLADGTLLGAYRTGKMIKHDYDFDFGVFSTKEMLTKLYNYLSKVLEPTAYECKLVDSYADKIEVWDPKSGIHSDVAERFFNVIMDLQLYTVDPDDDNLVVINYFRQKAKVDKKYKREWFNKMSVIEFEGFVYPSVSFCKEFLEVTYGYLGEDARYDPDTDQYYKISQDTVQQAD